MQFLKLQKPRGFEYTPRFYDPAKDQDEKHRIQFRRIRRSQPAQRSSPLRLLIMALILLFAILYLSKNAKFSSDPQAEKIIVEEIVVVD